MPGPRPARADVVFGLVWLAAFGVLQWSVVRYRVPIVLTLTAAAAVLGWWLHRRVAVRLDGRVVAGVLAVGAVVTVTVPLFSYLSPGGDVVARTTFVAASLGTAALLLVRRPAAAAVVALGGNLAVTATAVITDPAPRIDVWVTLQQAADALARGENFYAMTWSGSPGIQDAFTYLPWTAVLLAPGRWLAGDVRWMQAAWTVLLAAGLWWLGRPRETGTAGGERGAAGAVALLLLAPGTLTQVDQAWTEPLLLTGVVGWAALVRSGRPWWAVLPLALACASKQHLVLLLPVLMLWRPFGWRRAVATGAVAGLLVAPWVLASPADFLHDTVTLLVGFHPIRFANTLYLLALNTFGVTLPFWLTGVCVLAALGTAMAAVHRRQPDLGEVLRWCALVLAVANLVNKQAFYNQFWFVGGLVAASLAVPAGARSLRTARARRAAPATTG